MISLEVLKDKHRELVATVNRLKGAQAALLDRLRNDFGLSSLEEAQAELARLEEEHRKTTEKINAAIADIVDKYGDKLGIEPPPDGVWRG